MHSKINQVKINCLITCQYRQKQWHVDHAQLRMPADTLSSWYVPTYKYTPSSWHMLTHAETFHTLNASRYAAFDTCRHMQIHATCVHAQHLIRGNIWRTLYTQMHAATRKSQKCKLMLISLVQANKFRYMFSSVCANTSHCTQIHPQPLMLPDTSRYMTWPAQKHADMC
jgi:hypothetical protein